MLDDLSQYLQEKRALVEDHLREALGAARECPAGLLEAMHYGLLAPGKRLRPLLVLLAAESANGRDEQALPAAAAVEMIHAYSLIHDDLPAMDDDDLRRGQPTCHKRFGEALAILAGDALLTLAFQTLADGYPPVTASAACAELARAAGAVGMVGGQADDLAWEKGTGSGAVLEDLENVHARKTGALFRACLRLGLLVAQGERLGGVDPDLRTALDGYGRCFGQAFQITDDLLDVQGTVEQTGKRVQKDAARGKLTYPGFLGLEESRRRAGQLGRLARDYLRPVGRAGERLAALVELVLNRDR
jgi:geranylgeranyl diphosphate synthase type II